MRAVVLQRYTPMACYCGGLEGALGEGMCLLWGGFFVCFLLLRSRARTILTSLDLHLLVLWFRVFWLYFICDILCVVVIIRTNNYIIK